ncbi:hypothetical protein SEUCBS140593_008273 [Sporothrix eucalyptigena]|uniref:Uncharacterized protein n=1 Tax=Sporothrix eucalyptigena TaxID=1812306 RepID=A0ABP0CKI9_9PEZI
MDPMDAHEHSDHSDQSDSDDFDDELVLGERDPDQPKFKKELADALLEHLRKPGCFAGSRPFEQNSPGFKVGVAVNGVGAIKLPLQETQAQQIIAQARPATNGSDKEFSNMWELDPGQFRLTEDNNWMPTVKNVAMEDVSSVLGFHDSLLRATPDKMLLYGKDAHLEAQTQLPADPQMFGKLLILLPSEHEGGDVIVRQNEEIVTMSTQLINTPKKKNGLTFFAWYTDVQYEITPVTSGYLWALTYNLTKYYFPRRPNLPRVPQPVSNERLNAALKIWLYETEKADAFAKAAASRTTAESKDAEAALISIKQKKKAELAASELEAMELVQRAAVRASKKGNKAYHALRAAKVPPFSVFCLSSRYDSANPSFDTLDARDKNVVQALLEATADLPVDIFLCNIELAELGVCEESYRPYRVTSRLKKKWKFPKGQPLNDGKSMFHDLDNYLQIDYTIDEMYSINGRQLANAIPLKGDCIIYENFIDGMEFQRGFKAGSGMYTQLAQKVVEDMNACDLMSHRIAFTLLSEAEKDPYFWGKAAKLASLKGELLKAVGRSWLLSFYNQLIAFKEPSLANVATNLLSKMADDLKLLPAAEDKHRHESWLLMKDLWLSFLKQLVESVDSKDSTAIQDKARQDLKPLRRLAAVILGNMVELSLFDYPVKDELLYRRQFPMCPMTRAKNRKGKRVGPLGQHPCNICDNVNGFMMSPFNETLIISLPREHRLFIERETAQAKTWCADSAAITKIVPSTKGYKMETITLTKTWDQHDALCRHWNSDKAKVEKVILEAFSRDQLKALLETDDYQRIARMDCIKVPITESTVLPLFGELWSDLGERREDSVEKDVANSNCMVNLAAVEKSITIPEESKEASESKKSPSSSSPTQGTKRKADEELAKESKK